MCARSAATSARDVVPFGVLTIVVSSQSGASSGTRFWKNDEPPAPFGNRCISTGRPPHRAHQRRLDRLVVVDEVELGLPRSGNITLSGLVTRDRASRQLDVDVIGARHHQTLMPGPSPPEERTNRLSPG